MTGKPYDLDNDGVWSVFDLCLMKREVLKNMNAEANSDTLVVYFSRTGNTEKIAEYLIDLHAYVFYSLYVVNGATLMSVTGQTGVLKAIDAMGGVYMFGHNLPIWAVVLVEFVLAYTLEVTVGSPFSFKIASRIFDMKTTHPFIFETAIICATVTIMCPAMSFLAAFLYYPYKEISPETVRTETRPVLQTDTK